MTTIPSKKQDNSRSIFPTFKHHMEGSNLLTPHKHPYYLTPLRASLDDSISDFEEDSKTQNKVLCSLKRSSESPDTHVEDASPQKHDVYSEDFPPANPLTTVKFSMEADMLFGWKPKVAIKAPIPLKFPNPMLEEIITSIYYEKGIDPYPEIVYQGFRPDNTYVLHQMLATTDNYLSKVHPAVLVKPGMLRGAANTKRPFSGMREGVSENCLVFDSVFEQGNLDTVIMRDENKYDLFVRVDSNTKGHTNWYYFKTRNMKKGQTVKFSIMNMSKHDSLYQRGMKPYVFSEKLSAEKGISWEQSGEKIAFKLANISYLGHNYEENNRKKFYKVSFEYTFPYDDDTVSFALCIPYTYTQLLQYIETIIDNQKPSEHGEYITQAKICNSLGGVDVPILTITDPDESQIPLSKRQYIVCSGRVHPGEPNASWMIQGFIDELLKGTDEAKYLTKRFIFKIIPMLNPDGVILGNHRTGFCGNDLNRQYISPKEVFHPTVIALRDLIRDLTQEKKDAVFAYFDFHGHSLMKNVFMYGPEFPIHSYHYYKVKVLPKLISKRTPMFRYQACTYTIPKGKLATARAVFSMQFGVVHCYTLEASYSSYLNAEKESTPFNEESFMKMGCALVETIGDYKKLLEEEEAMAAAAFRARHELYNADTPELDTTFEDGATDDGDRKRNKFRLKKAKGKKAGGIKKGDNALGEGTRLTSVMKERRTRTEPMIFSEMSHMGGGIFKILEEIKEDALRKDTEETGSCDKLSEAGSDNGDSEDDLGEEEMKQLQENIISNLAELSKAYKMEYKPISKTRSKKSKKPEEKLKPVKRLLNQIVEKEVIEPPPQERSPIRQNQSPPRNTLGPAKQVHRAHNWITRIKQKTPLIPREVQMIVEKPSDSFEVQDQSYTTMGPFVATKNGFRRYLMSSHGQKKKQFESFDQSRKNTELTSQYLRSSVADSVQNTKKILEPKILVQEQSLGKSHPGILLKSKTCFISDDAVKIVSVEPESKPPVSRQGSLKALLGGQKTRSRPRLEKREAYSVDQKDLRDSFDNLTSNQIFYEKELTEKELDKSMEIYSEIIKASNGPTIPRLTIIHAQMRSDTTTSVGHSLKKDKKLPISYVAYKNNIQLKKKIRDRKLEGR